MKISVIYKPEYKQLNSHQVINEGLQYKVYITHKIDNKTKTERPK